MVYKFQVSSLDELSFFPRVWSAVLVKCDEGRFSSSVFTSPHTIGAARFGQLDAVHFSICWPLWHHCLVWLGSQNAFWSDSNHNGQSWNPELVFENTNGWCIFVADPKEIWNLLGCIAAFLLGWSRPFVLAPPRISGSVLWDLCCWCALALYPKCLPTRQTLVRACFQTTGSLSTACVC